ncbi:RHS repeat-associated core domain-containing protein [Pseudomonas sp. Teo4]|uniref:RHS repeat-associated core domain-containing protein n=1 Tax=Pseudomonas sp. Teo4 TaxID=3064528 RepID=UPI002ABC56B0|nr:RHS repeat-associated core domain-containing protein [Pseudomonas sp. Teo4]MDZ3994943.1 hypothetical protein [Pseudomonas sp. Teo4]
MEKSLNRSLFFYQNGKLTTVRQGAQPHNSPPRACPLAELRTTGAETIGLLVTDNKGSVLGVEDINEKEPHIHSVYGHDPTIPSPATLLGFNGQPGDAILGAYLLGNGYRSHYPTLMRFGSPDNLSPFGKGGINAYSYCEGDPVNNIDPSGHFIINLLRTLFNRIFRSFFKTAPKADMIDWLASKRLPSPPPRRRMSSGLISSSTRMCEITRPPAPKKRSLEELIWTRQPSSRK